MTLAFLGIGYVLDRWLGTKPSFMIGLVVLGLIGEFVRFWYDYDARMKVLEAQRAQRGARARICTGRPSMNDIAFSMAAPLPGPAPEVAVSNDMIKRGLIVAPVLIAAVRTDLGHQRRSVQRVQRSPSCWSTSRWPPGIVAVTAKISLALMMGAVLFGYLVRLGLIFLAVVLGEGRRLDFASGTRSDHHLHSPGSLGVGAEVRGDLARLPGPQAQALVRQLR